MEDRFTNEDNERLQSTNGFQISPGEIQEPKCNLRPFRYYEIIIAILVISLPYVVLAVLPIVLTRYYKYTDSTGINYLGIYLGILYIILAHFIYKKTFCTIILNPAYCFFTAPLAEYIRIVGILIYILVLLISDGFKYFLRGFNMVLLYLTFFFTIIFPNEVLCRFTIFNIFMDLLRFVKRKVLISLIIASVFSGVVSLQEYYFLYYFFKRDTKAGIVVTQLLTNGVIGFYYNVIYFKTGNMWTCIILHSTYYLILLIFDITAYYIISYIYLVIALVYSILLYLNIIKWFQKSELIDNEIQNFFHITTNKNQFE